MPSPTTSIRPSAFIDSHLRCVKCSKRMVQDIGQDENHGDITIRHDCLSCGYSEHAPRSVADARRRSDVPAVRAVHDSLVEALLKQRLGGVEIPMRIDDAAWPEEVW